MCSLCPSRTIHQLKPFCSERGVGNALRTLRKHFRALHDNQMLGHPAYKDPLQYWRNRDKRFTLLHNLVRMLLSIPATSAPSERCFSNASFQQAEKALEYLEQIIFVQDAVRRSHPGKVLEEFLDNINTYLERIKPRQLFGL